MIGNISGVLAQEITEKENVVIRLIKQEIFIGLFVRVFFVGVSCHKTLVKNMANKMMWRFF